MSSKQVTRRTGGLWWSLGVVVAGILFLPSVSNAETIGNNLWNFRENNQAFFANNDSWVRPWRGAYDDGWGMWQGGHQGAFLWLTSSTTGNPLDGSLSIARGVDHQFDAWTFLYVSTPTTVSLTGDGDCVPRWFLNYAFDSPQQFPLSSPASISLSAGWNRLDITGYNQSDGFLFTTNALASQVAIMNTAPVPEPSAICALASLLLAVGLAWLIRNRRTLRTVLALLAVVSCLTSFADAETIGNNLWNLRENGQDFFHDNDSWVRPWRGATDDGWGEFQGGHQLMFLWDASSTTGNPLDGSLSIDRGVNHQFDVWTFLYVPTPTTISLTGQGDCVPRWFLNYQFDSPQLFPIGAPASINLNAGWNRLDITGYNQNTDFLFESGALASQVSIMNTSPVPEPSTICVLGVFLAASGALVLARSRAVRQLFLAATAVAFAAPLPARGEIIPPDLPVGSQYELAFVTRGARDATTPYIADYNSFVTAQAQQNPNLPQGITWNAVASAAGDIHGIGQADANQNAPFTPSIPVYNTAGQLVANATTPLYSAIGILINAIDYDQFGNAWATPVWTGSNTDGTADKPLGGQQSYGAPNTGYSTATNAQWIHNGYDSQGSPWPLYALSSPITIVPEPSTTALLAFGALAAAGIAALGFLRRGPLTEKVAAEHESSGEKHRKNVTAHDVIMAGVLIALAAPVLAHAEYIPPNLPPGSKYELVFVTRNGRDATSPYIVDYNSFVTAQAQQNPNLPPGVTWNAIASTIGDINTGLGMADANQNAPFTPSIPVYNTFGQLVANATTPLYGTTGTILNPIDYDQFGTIFSTPVWTGSNIDGTSDKPLGGQPWYGAPYSGYSTNTNAIWIHGGTESQIYAMPLYALSSPITIVPEPSALALLAFGALTAASIAARTRNNVHVSFSTSHLKIRRPVP